jgi:hypothetical protein
MTIQSLPLLLTPKLLVSMLAAEPRRITDLETYLSRSLALLLLAFAALNLLLTGVIPTTNTSATSSDESSSGLSSNPYAVPTVIVTTTYHAATAFYIYTNLTSTPSFGFGAGLFASTLLFCVGLWVVVFGSEKVRISKKTGADKRTGNWPFENKESAREIKKESRREDKEARREEKAEKEKERSKRKSVARTSSWR